jgi:hypothetical protein
MTVEEFFGTLQESVVTTWRKHLKTKKYSSHMALDEYYKEAPELIDALIEGWQGTHDKIENYVDLLAGKEFETAVDYLTELRKITKEGRSLMDSSELESDTDAILSLIDGVIYKLKELKEGIGLVNYLRVLTESRTDLKAMTQYTESWAKQCWKDKEFVELFTAITNGIYRELSERTVADWSDEEAKKVANDWMDKIEEMLKIIKK